jgi:hypothetical protein
MKDLFAESLSPGVKSRSLAATKCDAYGHGCTRHRSGFQFCFYNNGSVSASSYTIIDPIPVQTDFKVSSATTGLGTTGLTITVEYSNDNAATWTYTPVSAGGGAAVDYDRSITHVRWRFTGTLSQISPNNTGSVGFTARVQ